MHEGAICREIIDVVSSAALANDISKVYEIVLRVGPYSCVHEGQLNFYFEIMSKDTIMQDAIIVVEEDETLSGISQMYIKTFKGD